MHAAGKENQMLSLVRKPVLRRRVAPLQPARGKTCTALRPGRPQLRSAGPGQRSLHISPVQQPLSTRAGTPHLSSSTGGSCCSLYATATLGPKATLLPPPDWHLRPKQRPCRLWPWTAAWGTLGTFHSSSRSCIGQRNRVSKVFQ